ncbi:hypothetical protein [Pseudonocardia sp. UM4_GMWB1]|uniref:hypothetical protein n=1 Tax=Pseudonocardia sp. UM4_GMWB1 TaxID=2212989 RepID=UPI00307DE5D0
MPLSARQTALLADQLPGHEVVADHGWGLVGTTVLQIRHAGADLIVKAGDDADTHIARELRAHREWLAPLVARGRAPELRHADADAKLLVTPLPARGPGAGHARRARAVDLPRRRGAAGAAARPARRRRRPAFHD